MNFEWIILDNIIFGFDKNFNLQNPNKILLFDLDNTIIKTKSGKVFPINKNDWLFLEENIPNKLNLLYKNNIIGIITNQKGLTSKYQIDEWINKIKLIYEKSKFHFIFASLKDDNYRKPLPSSFDYIKENLLKNINIDLMKSKNKIYYIGDAFGREKDHSDTDVKYAINCKLKFKTPEMFFKLDEKIDKNGTITYPEINYYDKDIQNKIFSSLYKLIEGKQKVLIMMIGFPASGKSYLRKEIIKKFYYFKYFNYDDIYNSTIKDSNTINETVIYDNLVKDNINTYECLIDDNTNMNSKKRLEILDKFSTHYKIGIYFDYDIDTCKHLNYMRMFWFGAKLVPQVVYRTINKSINNNNIENNFDKFIRIDKIFYNFDYDDKIKYYF
jgi:bifunctional polynucleotide phosphatase/kinase